MDMIIEEARRVLMIESAAIADLVPRIDSRFETAVALCHACRGHVVVIGMGKSGLIGKKIAATLASTGTPAFFLHPAEGIHGDLGMVARQDVALAISNSGETEEILRILPSIKRLGLPLIAMTGNIKSTLGKMGDSVLDISVREEACPLGLAPTASTTAALAMGDALAIALLQKRGFQREDFASFHPGGQLGRTLLLTVANVMRTGGDVPVVAPETAMGEVILEMTAKGLGVTAVVAEDGRLVGVITDGDLRRRMKQAGSASGDLFSQAARAVMNPDPKTISSDTLAAQAVHTMEQHQITALIVTRPPGVVEGIVHLHDLLKRGVV